MKLWQKKPAPALPPVGVGLYDVHDALESTRSGQVVLGLGETGPMMLDLEFSHTLIVGDTGSGTSGLVRTVLAQALADGAEVVIVDRARLSHRWTQGHPDVTQVWTLDEIAGELVRLGEELERRQAAAASDALNSRRLVLAIEHRAGLAEALQERWMELRQTGDPKRSPAAEALQALEWCSPLLGIHLVATANSGVWMSAQARAPYGIRILSGRVGELAWPVFTNGLPRPLAATSRRPGRFWVVRGVTTVPLTALHLLAEEAQHLPAALIAAARREWGVA
ncbi:hypothetical protein [Nocardioides sp. NPDC006273]|uniref:hypothetical protein n=1 Tax=Nocardioides sp. NPDC006273 TaxID=3155598 RepID=UPI0033A74D90